jgi:hypothetical protein
MEGSKNIKVNKTETVLPSQLLQTSGQHKKEAQVGLAQVVKRPPSKQEALSSNPEMKKKKGVQI